MSVVLRGIFVYNEHKLTLENLSNIDTYWKVRGFLIIKGRLKSDASKRQNPEQNEEYGKLELKVRGQINGI